MKLRESHIEQAITSYLELDGWRALKTDPVSRREWAKGFGEKGMADHLFIRYGWSKPLTASDLITRLSEVMWIEHKRPGQKAKQHQRDWHAAERARGALTLIAGEDFEASIEGFASWYRASGLQRRKIRLAAREAS